MKPLVAALLGVLGVGCAAPGWHAPAASVAAAVRVEVAQVMGRIASDLAARGQQAWLEHFAVEPGFFMAADGVMQLHDHAAAVSFLRDFAPSVADTQLTWSDLRIEPLSADLAMVSAHYAEQLTTREGAALKFAGHFTGVVWRTPRGWKIGHCHWSSPRP